MGPHRAPSPEAGAEAAAGLTFSVVVAAWHPDSKDDLHACVAALGRQTLAPHEVIVVIDHNPELATWARGALEAVTVLENRHERGIVGARNTGSEQARGEVVAFTDDDAAADPDWLENLAVAFADETTIGVGGELVPDWQGAEPRWYPPEFYWVFGCSYRGLPTRELKHGDAVISGGHALDDTKLGIAVGRAFPEMRWLHQPAARVRHKVPSTRASFRYLLIRGFEEGEGKAALAEKVGADSGLESERRHLFVTIPRGFALGFADLLRGDRYGPARSLALLAGVAATAGGFLVASLRGRLRRDPSPPRP
jgi:glycosyltransferase involved in cell wall biosynthesis